MSISRLPRHCHSKVPRYSVSGDNLGLCFDYGLLTKRRKLENPESYTCSTWKLAWTGASEYFEIFFSSKYGVQKRHQVPCLCLKHDFSLGRSYFTWIWSSCLPWHGDTSANHGRWLSLRFVGFDDTWLEYFLGGIVRMFGILQRICLCSCHQCRLLFFAYFGIIWCCGLAYFAKGNYKFRKNLDNNLQYVFAVNSNYNFTYVSKDFFFPFDNFLAIWKMKKSRQNEGVTHWLDCIKSFTVFSEIFLKM